VIHFDHPRLKIVVDQHVKAQDFERFTAKLELISEADGLVLKHRSEDLHNFGAGVSNRLFDLLDVNLATRIALYRVPKRC